MSLNVIIDCYDRTIKADEMRYIPHLFYFSSFVLLAVIISTVFSIANAAECSDSPASEKVVLPPATQARMWLQASKCDAHHADDPEGHTSCLIAVYNETFCMPIWRIPGLEVERKKS